MTDWKEIQREYETTKITLSKIAEKYGIPLGTIKSQKSRDAKNGNPWVRDAEKDATKGEKVATIPKKDATEEKPKKSERYPNGHPGNKNPSKKFTERNQAARKHGLFSRYIPKETLEIMGMLEEKEPADLIWDQITIQYAAIIRSQTIMFVESKDEMIKELKKVKVSDSGGEEEWNFQFAWERQAQFLNAQSRAISELRNSINQFLRLADEDDERRLKLEQMQLNIKKTQIEIDHLDKSNKVDTTNIVIVDEWGNG